MQEPPAHAVSERDLDEVLRSLEAELLEPPSKTRDRDDATAIHVLPRRAEGYWPVPNT